MKSFKNFYGLGIFLYFMYMGIYNYIIQGDIFDLFYYGFFFVYIFDNE